MEISRRGAQSEYLSVLLAKVQGSGNIDENFIKF